MATFRPVEKIFAPVCAQMEGPEECSRRLGPSPSLQASSPPGLLPTPLAPPQPGLLPEPPLTLRLPRAPPVIHTFPPLAFSPIPLKQPWPATAVHPIDLLHLLRRQAAYILAFSSIIALLQAMKTALCLCKTLLCNGLVHCNVSNAQVHHLQSCASPLPSVLGSRRQGHQCWGQGDKAISVGVKETRPSVLGSRRQGLQCWGQGDKAMPFVFAKTRHSLLSEKPP